MTGVPFDQEVHLTRSSPTRYSILKLIYKILILVDFAYKTNLKKKTGTCLLKAPNILLYYFVSIKSLLSTTLQSETFSYNRGESEPISHFLLKYFIVFDIYQEAVYQFI